MVLIAVIFILGIFACTNACGQDFQVTELANKVMAFRNPELGECQLVIASDKGLVVLNSFWSSITADKFKQAITENLKRDDFIYLINMIDRLDIFGGNAAYGDISIIGHKAFWDKYRGKEDEVRVEIDRLINMWRFKEEGSRERLKDLESGSDQAVSEERWMNTCRERAEDLEQGFSLVLPTEVYEDRKTLNLGDLTVNLIWFGRAGYEGESVIIIPKDKLAIIPGFLLHPQHLAPYPQARFARLDVPRWIEVLEEILEGDNAVDYVICGDCELWTRARAHEHLRYIRDLWNRVAEEEAAGRTLEEINDKLSLENEFAFIKDMPEYINNGDDWIRPQHLNHTKLFFLQHKNHAIELLENTNSDALTSALAKIRELRDGGDDLYIDEGAVNNIGYTLMATGRFGDAAKVLKLNVEAFPQSANAFDSYAEALMKNGDTKDAILNYKKSLELNPDNQNAKDMLKTLEAQ